MGQNEILAFLKNHPGEEFSSEDLAILLGTTRDVTNNSLLRMRKRNEIGWRKAFLVKGRGYLYHHQE